MRVWVGLAVGVAGVWQSSAAPKPPEPLKRGPLSYYSEHCRRCHGPFGGAYEENFTKGMSAQDLTDTIKSMAEGQGGSPLSDANELAAQVAFHYAIDLKKPFLSWTVLDGRTVSGEVTPKAKVVATLAGADVPVTLSDGIWKVVLPADASVRKLVITASVGDVKSTLDLSKSAWTLLSRP